jgi:hypothetical protein
MSSKFIPIPIGARVRVSKADSPFFNYTGEIVDFVKATSLSYYYVRHDDGKVRSWPPEYLEILRDCTSKSEHRNMAAFRS